MPDNFNNDKNTLQIKKVTGRKKLNIKKKKIEKEKQNKSSMSLL